MYCLRKSSLLLKSIYILPALKKHLIESSVSRTCRINHRSGSLSCGVCDRNIKRGCISNSFLEAFLANRASKWKTASPTVLGSLKLENATYNRMKRRDYHLGPLFAKILPFEKH